MGGFKMSSEVNYYDAVLADLRQRRARIDTAIAAIEELMSGQGGLPPSAPTEGGDSFPDTAGANPPEPTPPTLSKQIKEDTFFNLSTVQAARKFLSMMKRPAATGEMVAAFQQGGFLTNAKNFYSNLYTSLKRSPDFVNVKGKWGLAEWYPSRARSAKKAGAVVEEGGETEPKPEPKRLTGAVARRAVPSEKEEEGERVD
jgi:hypothetical protein